MTPGISEMDLPAAPARKRMRLSLKGRKGKSSEDLNNNAARPSSSTSSVGGSSISSSGVSLVTDSTHSEIVGASSSMSNNTRSTCSNTHSSCSDIHSTCTESSTARDSESAATSHSSSKTSLTSWTSTSDSQSESTVPAVASLYNSGNTCFLNSVLQVLRYTPSFLDNLAFLYQDIQATERIKRRNKDEEEDEVDPEDESCRKSWKVVKTVYKVYRDQSLLEQRYEEVASDDVMSMAVKPLSILDAVRDLNPMFEGSLQHDAQEFLRCLLCYLQDAEKCIQKFSSQLPHKFSPKAVLHPAMQKLLKAAAAKQNAEKQSQLTGNIPLQTGGNSTMVANDKENSAVIGSETVKVNLFPKTEPKMAAIKSPVKIRVDPAEGDTADSVTETMDASQPCGAGMEPARSQTTASNDDSQHTNIKQIVGRVRRMRSMTSQSKESVCSENSSPIKTRSSLGADEKESQKSRKSCVEVNSEDDIVCNAEKNSTVLHNEIKQTNSGDKMRELKKGAIKEVNSGKVIRKRGRSFKTKGKVDDKKAAGSTISRRRGAKMEPKNQPQQSDIDIAEKKTYSKKRLGMNGAVKKTSENLFDAMQSEESKHLFKKSQVSNDDVVKDESKTLISTEQSNMSASKVKRTENVCTKCEEMDTAELGKSLAADEKSGALKSLSDSRIKLEPDSQLRSSYQDMFSHFLTTVADCGSDTVSDSDSEDIVLKKKREKLIHESPRRSPRKVMSEMVKPSPMKYIPSKLCFDSKSETKNVNKTNNILKTEVADVAADSMKAEKDLNANTNAVVQTSNSDGKQNTAGKVTVSPTKCYSSGAISDSKTVDKLHADFDQSDDMMIVNNSDSSTTAAAQIPTEPFVKLENCDHVFTDNAKSVSARYAAECLTPRKLSPGRNPSAGNYLKQRKSLDGPDALDEAELQQALLEMLNSPVKSRSKYDLTERLFQGTMMLRTCCLECESSWERQEEFHDISVPVRVENVDSDSEDEHGANNEVSSRSLLQLIEASTEVERLQDNNKYFCDECCSKVEAERSIHYAGLPNILTLHLKRFSHDMGNLGSISKINDPVEVPLTLPCLHYKCPSSCLRPDHKYTLYAIISHSGATLSSGHYRAYVRALPKPATSQLSMNHFTNLTSALEETAKTQCVETANCEMEPANRHATRRQTGVAPKLPSRFNDDVVTDTKVKAFSSVAQKKNKPCITDTVKTCERFTSEWFECDDETVRVFDAAEFLDRLSGKDGCLLGSPYLLFYHKSTLC